MPTRNRLLILIGMLAALLSIRTLLAAEVATELPPGVQIPEAARPGPDFNVENATQAYLALLTPEQRARSDAYFEGGYWLQLWQFLYGIAVLFLVLSLGWSARLRDWSQRITGRRWLQSFLFGLMFLPLIWALSLPMSWYASFIREHHYGLSNQDLGGWLWDAVKGMFVYTVGATIVIVGIYGFVRRAGAGWWRWASGFMCVFLIFVFLITPVYLAPLFNDYRPLKEDPVRDAVLSLARANMVPADDVMWFDASKQTKRIGANVSGLFGTTQVSLNDNLLNRTSLPEIKAVMGHEMGHYVLHHALIGVASFTVLFGLGFFILERFFERARLRWGARWGIHDRGDPAGLPLAFAILSVYLFLATPVMNRMTFVQETEADLFGLNAAREPYGFATVSMRLGAYRKLEPSALEEWVFYDHPSGRQRVEMAMRWLKENQPLVAADLQH